MPDPKLEEKKIETPAAPSADEQLNPDGTPKDPAGQDPLKPELEKVQKKGKRSKADQLRFQKRKINEQLLELGESDDEDSDDELESDEDDKPVTVGMLKKLQQESAAKTALQLADEITNETERELVKYHLQHSIKSTGNPQEDLKLSRAIVNNIKNQQILDEQNRKPSSPSAPGNPGAPSNPPQGEDELTAEEQSYMSPPFNLTKKEILAARAKSK